MEAKDNPSTVSSDYGAMIPVGDGRRHPRRTGTPFGRRPPPSQNMRRVPDAGWRLRVASSPWRPEFEDGLRGICAKPFTRKVAGSAPDVIIGVMDEARNLRRGGLVDDIDGRATVSTFLRAMFSSKESPRGWRRSMSRILTRQIFALRRKPRRRTSSLIGF